jgi:hypothetical protein
VKLRRLGPFRGRNFPNERRVHTLALIQDRASDLWMPSSPFLKNPVTGRCEKIDFSRPTDFQLEKDHVRMGFKRLPRLRYTFPVKNKTSINQPNQFFHILQTGRIPDKCGRCFGLRNGERPVRRDDNRELSGGEKTFPGEVRGTADPSAALLMNKPLGQDLRAHS